MTSSIALPLRLQIPWNAVVTSQNPQSEAVASQIPQSEAVAGERVREGAGQLRSRDIKS